MLEAKAMLALVLQRFAFVVAPEYVYAPTDFLALQPLLGFPVVLKFLDLSTSECLSHPKAAVRGGKGVLAMSIRCGVVVSLLRDHGMIDVLVQRV